MRTEFRKVELPRELRSLLIFDRKVFGSDAFDRDDWQTYESWWLLVDGVKAGCCAFERHAGFAPEDSGHFGEIVATPGSLYIATTGILPRLQRHGLGTIFKAWQVSYARQHGFTRIVTNSRESNAAMIGLNRRFGFREFCKVGGYYDQPVEAAILMELDLTSRA
jgi:GNAT superfamily N-acetyltransferase